MPYADPDKQRAYEREWIAKRRAEWFAGKSCVDCGATEQLEIDHVDPRQKVGHTVWSWRAERREAELAKCVVRCDDCHEKRHGKGRHGIGRYGDHGCRCEICRAAKSAANKRYLERKRLKETKRV